jgi:hypothetical protein
MNQGDILIANDKSKHPHPIIYIEEIDSENFYGCIISHEAGKGNVKMESEHFLDKDENDKPYPVQYDDSYLIPQNLKKEKLWITDKTVKGKLTDEGIAFVLSNIPGNKDASFHPRHIGELKK